MDEMREGKTKQSLKFAQEHGHEVLVIKNSGMREIPLREEDRLKLATEMEIVQSAWNRMQAVYTQWIEGAIIHQDLAHALVVISVELADSFPETDALGNELK